MPVELSQDQKNVHDALFNYLKSPRPKFATLGGYAGTGKTTLINALLETVGKELGLRVAVCTYTGKAAEVVRSKLTAPHDYCGTLHRLLYRPLVHEHSSLCPPKCNTPYLSWMPLHDCPDEFDYDAIVVDEASMVTEDIHNELLTFGVPVIYVGDHGQLPPVNSDFSLMKSPDLRLEKIHRQAEGNPIIRLSRIVREGGAVSVGDYGLGVRKVRGLDYINSLELDDWLLLVGLNRTRQQFNRSAREGKRDMPEAGEKVICLKNNARKGIYNGMVGTVLKSTNATDHHYDMVIAFDSLTEPYEGRVFKHQFGQQKTLMNHPTIPYKYFGDQFDYGYCLTVHKAQGSEADKVCLVQEPMHFLKGDYRRWLYTGITRARKELIIIQP